MLGRHFLAIAAVFFLAQNAYAADSLNLDSFEHLDGFVDQYWDADSGRILLDVGELDQPIIYQASLARGLGSNDLGLDRGQLGDTKIVRFVRSGPKVLMSRTTYNTGRLVIVKMKDRR